MDGFYITVKNGLLDPKHFKGMHGDKDSGAIWLFLWFLDRMTIIDGEKGEGKVLGGKPLKFEEIKKTIDISRRTYQTWLNILREGNYITTDRTPFGLSVTVHKAFKVFGQKPDVRANAHHKESESDVSITAHHTQPRPFTSQYIDNIEDNTKNVKETVKEKNGFLKKLPRISIDPDYVKYLADLIEEQTGDKKSRKAFEIIASKIPENIIREALSEIKSDGARNKGAVLITRAKQYAERNI